MSVFQAKRHINELITKLGPDAATAQPEKHHQYLALLELAKTLGDIEAKLEVIEKKATYR